MKKYFQNKNPVTVEKLLQTYGNNFFWGDHPEFNTNRRICLNLIAQCQQSDQYKDYKQKLNQLQNQIRQAKLELKSIEADKVQIILKNSEAEYKQVHDQLRERQRKLTYEKQTLMQKPPKSKHDLLEPIYEAIKKAERRADEEMQERYKRNAERCHCNKGSYCQC